MSDIHLAPLPPLKPGELFGRRMLGYLSWHRHRKALHRIEVLDALVRDWRAQSIDHTVITGDLTNLALPKEFKAVARWLEGLEHPQRLTVIPGNHDAYVPGAGERGWRLWTEFMRGDESGALPSFPFVRQREGVALIGLSTAVPTRHGFATGLLGTAQLALLRRALERLGERGACRVVLLHHPPVAGWSKSFKCLLDAAAFREVIAATGAELVLCGHEHVLKHGTLSGPDAPVPVVMAPAATLLLGTAARCGGYLLYEIERHAGRWSVPVEERRFDPGLRRVRAMREAAALTSHSPPAMDAVTA